MQPGTRWAVRIAVVLGTVACALLGAGAVASTAASAPCACDAEGPRVAQQSASAEQQLAEKYAPIVYIRDQSEACDARGSPYVPVPVEFVFDVDGIALRKHEGGRTTEEGRAIDAADLYGKDDSYFLDFPGNPKRPACTYERDFLSRVDEYAPTAYAHIAREEGREGFALQYWLFYYFNHWNNTHEGDWEMVQLTFDGPTAADALAQDPTGVGYSQHGSGERAEWDDGKLSKDGSHPIAYVAAGANANQFEPNIILGRGENGTGFGCDDARRPSRRIAPEVRLMEEPLDASSEYAWLAYDGRWGQRAPWEFNGPTGPNDKRAWREPFSWQEDLRPSSIAVPTDTFGPNTVQFFCDAVWYLSSPFSVLLRVPPAVVFAAMTVAFAGLVFVATRTRYRPVETAPMRRRRRFGQLLRAAVRIYGRNIALFIGMSIVFVPAGIVEAAIQWLLFSPPFVDTVSGYFSVDLVVQAAIAIAVGNVASSVVYWFVVCVSTAAVARLDAGEPASVLAAARDVARQLPGLVVARLKAVAIVALLAVTVVGIPWAIRNGYRWAFIEESILLDGTPSREARGASARVVEGRWWHTFACLSALGLLAYGASATVAMVLLFFSPASVSVINITSTLVFVAVVPFVAISQCLFYFNVTAAEDP